MTATVASFSFTRYNLSLLLVDAAQPQERAVAVDSEDEQDALQLNYVRTKRNNRARRLMFDNID